MISSSLRESMPRLVARRHRSISAGIAGFIGPVVFGFGGGSSSAGSTANQRSSHDVAGTMLNQARDRTMQAASAVRSQRATVVQTARQGESVRVQTDVIANHNHCHAMTIEYFEVLRHLQVTQEIADVQECLFVPFEITPFNGAKALRHRDALVRHVPGGLRRGFDALERMRTNWADADFPLARYADEPLTYLDGELQISFSIPRPADGGTDKDQFDASKWSVYEASGLLPQPAQTLWNAYLGTALVAQRDAIFAASIAPNIAQRIVDRLALRLVLDGGSPVFVGIDATLVSRYRPDAPLLVSLRPTSTTPAVVRAQIDRAVISLGGVAAAGGQARRPASRPALPHRAPGARPRADAAHVQRPRPDRRGRVDRRPRPAGEAQPHAEDLRMADALIDHLNEFVEHYHQAAWREMDPNRRYLLLDGFLAPNAGGRSVASVVENRLDRHRRQLPGDARGAGRQARPVVRALQAHPDRSARPVRHRPGAADAHLAADQGRVRRGRPRGVQQLRAEGRHPLLAVGGLADPRRADAHRAGVHGHPAHDRSEPHAGFVPRVARALPGRAHRTSPVGPRRRAGADRHAEPVRRHHRLGAEPGQLGGSTGGGVEDGDVLRPAGRGAGPAAVPGLRHPAAAEADQGRPRPEDDHPGAGQRAGDEPAAGARRGSGARRAR